MCSDKITNLRIANISKIKKLKNVYKLTATEVLCLARNFQYLCIFASPYLEEIMYKIYKADKQTRMSNNIFV